MAYGANADAAADVAKLEHNSDADISDCGMLRRDIFRKKWLAQQVARNMRRYPLPDDGPDSDARAPEPAVKKERRAKVEDDS